MYKKEKKVAEVANIESLFDDLFQSYKTGEYVFRGISKEEHYAPTLFREFIKVKGVDENYSNVWVYEKELLEKFAQYSIQYIPSFNDPLDWVASAQHFGLPTRLLDWTYNPFFALYFSVFYNEKKELDKNEDAYYRLLVAKLEDNFYFNSLPNIDPLYFHEREDTTYPLLAKYIYLVKCISGNLEENHMMTNSTARKKFDDFLEKVRKEANNSKLFFCTTNLSNPRLVAQNGLFQIPRTFGLGEEKGWLKNDIHNGCYKIYKIHKSIRKEIMSFLENMNINSFTLFPDLQNICEYIKRTAHQV